MLYWTHYGETKHYMPTFRAQIVFEMLKGEKTVTLIAGEYPFSRLSGQWPYRKHQVLSNNERIKFVNPS